MNLIVGLGNPGSGYAQTRHNIGFQSVDAISSKNKIQLSHTDLLCQWGKGFINRKEVLLAKPQTYMNLSGRAILTLISSFHLSQQDLFVIYDDMDLPLGRLRIRKWGGSGGHRGMESIIQCLETSHFPRLRIGIGRPDDPQNSKEYVLTKFLKKEQAIAIKIIGIVTQCIETVLVQGTLEAMNKFNNVNIEE